jgi:DNA-binding CsgD family transcriptional regulator
MLTSQQLNDSLVELALQRTLSGFEDALKRTMGQFGLAAWACVFPASLQAGGRPLFVAHGVKTTGDLLKRAARDGLASLGFETQSDNRLLDAFASELAPRPDIRWRVLRVTRDRTAELTIFLYRAGALDDFTPEELGLLGRVGQHLNRCFLLLAQQQEQEFMAGLLRLVSNLYSEGLCVLDEQYRAVFENRNFREHMLLWAKGRAALQNLTLPRQTTLPGHWTAACDEAFAAFRKLSFGPSPNRLVVTQGPLVRLNLPLSATEVLEGNVRYIAFQSTLGVRPYLLLISNRQLLQAVAAPTVTRIAQAFKFSRRERQLAELILEGRSAQEISRKLAISMPTVKTHIRNILRKSGAKTRLQFAGLCRQPG